MDTPSPGRRAPVADDALRARLLAWYDRARRELPWRTPPGVRADPYRVWASEIMLQQTTAAAVAPYFARFVERWPRVEDLAAADLDAVLHAWQGLGYYARARNLHACARAVAAAGGRFPDSEEALRALPGVGAYTAAAIAAIAFDRQTTPVDGNVVRVLARLDAVDTPLPAARVVIEARARALAPARRAGDFAQALMDLGATVCTPRQPRCLACPWRDPCAARAGGDPAAYPRRVAKKDRSTRYGVAFWIERSDGAVLLRKRPPRGLLGGMMEVPSTPWRDEPWTDAEAAQFAPVGGASPSPSPSPNPWRAIAGTVGHTFTHFHLEMAVLVAPKPLPATPEPVDGAAVWAAVGALDRYALPTLTKKIVRHVTAGGAPVPARSVRRRQES